MLAPPPPFLYYMDPYYPAPRMPLFPGAQSSAPWSAEQQASDPHTSLAVDTSLGHYAALTASSPVNLFDNAWSGSAQGTPYTERTYVDPYSSPHHKFGDSPSTFKHDDSPAFPTFSHMEQPAESNVDSVHSHSALQYPLYATANSSPSPVDSPPSMTAELGLSQTSSDPGIYTYRQQAQFFRDALTLPTRVDIGPFVQQPIYKPHTNSDRKRYVEEVLLDPPIFFRDTEGFYGIRLVDALRCKFRGLENAEEAVFQGRGPSVSIRLEWPGYRRWSRQIPTRDFRTPPGPITRAKLAKSVAKCVQRFVEDREMHSMEDDSDPRWRVGRDPSAIRLEDLLLVSIYHVSMGSWQPHLRLLRPL